MKTIKVISFQCFLFFATFISAFSQKELEFGNKKIRIQGEEVSSYMVKTNSHIIRNYMKIENGVLLYTSVEFEGNVPVKIELTECQLADLDKSSCAVAQSEQGSLYDPGRLYILYLYTNKDAANIITTLYDKPGYTAIVQKSSVARLKFMDEKIARIYLEEHIQ